MASAKLAKSTVNHNQMEICSTNVASECRVKTRSKVVTAAPTSVTNITGFFHMWTGLSLRKLSKIAGTTISRSNKGRALVDIEFLNGSSTIRSYGP